MNVCRYTRHKLWRVLSRHRAAQIRDLSDCSTRGYGDIVVLGSHRLSCRCRMLMSYVMTPFNLKWGRVVFTLRLGVIAWTLWVPNLLISLLSSFFFLPFIPFILLSSLQLSPAFLASPWCQKKIHIHSWSLFSWCTLHLCRTWDQNLTSLSYPCHYLYHPPDRTAEAAWPTQVHFLGHIPACCHSSHRL